MWRCKIQKTKIEWVKNPDGSHGYAINPVKGLCPMACSYCYARAMYKRFKWNPEIRWKPEVFIDLVSIRKPSRIFIGSTIELFGDWVKAEWLKEIFQWYVPRFPQHTFIFLTKQPQNLVKFSPFPPNCFVGVTATNREKFVSACTHLEHISARVKYLSLEPLLDWHDGQGVDIKGYLRNAEVNWLIIGAQTRPLKFPKLEWVREIVESADEASIPVFLKDNLLELVNHKSPETDFAFNKEGYYRQEMPI